MPAVVQTFKVSSAAYQEYAVDSSRVPVIYQLRQPLVPRANDVVQIEAAIIGIIKN